MQPGKCHAGSSSADVSRSTAKPTLNLLLIQLDAAEEWEDEVEGAVQQLYIETGRRAIYTVCFY